MEKRVADLNAQGVYDANLATQLAVLQLHGGYCERVAISQSKDLQETKGVVQQHTQAFTELITEVQNLWQQVATAGGGGGGGAQRLGGGGN